MDGKRNLIILVGALVVGLKQAFKFRRCVFSTDIDTLSSSPTVEGSTLTIDTVNGLKVNEAKVIATEVESDIRIHLCNFRYFRRSRWRSINVSIRIINISSGRIVSNGGANCRHYKRATTCLANYLLGAHLVR